MSPPDESLGPVAALFGNYRFTTADASRSHLSLTESNPPPTECIACGDPLQERDIILTCSHHWCPSCLEATFAAVKNEGDFPPKCAPGCRVMFVDARPYLPEDLAQKITERVFEWNVPAKRRVYCSNPQCAKFLYCSLPQYNEFDCPDCLTSTCTHCKTTAHPGLKCPPPDLEERQVMALSLKKGWKQCKNCGRVCEKIEGCDYMDCLCGSAFCYPCGNEVSPFQNGCRCRSIFNVVAWFRRLAGLTNRIPRLGMHQATKQLLRARR